MLAKDEFSSYFIYNAANSVSDRRFAQSLNHWGLLSGIDQCRLVLKKHELDVVVSSFLHSPLKLPSCKTMARKCWEDIACRWEVSEKSFATGKYSLSNSERHTLQIVAHRGAFSVAIRALPRMEKKHSCWTAAVVGKKAIHSERLSSNIDTNAVWPVASLMLRLFASFSLTFVLPVPLRRLKQALCLW